MINLYPNLMRIYFNKSINKKIDYGAILSSQFWTFLLINFISTKFIKILY
jgi:hypothetical protein